MELSETLGELLMLIQRTTKQSLSKLFWTAVMGLIAFTMVIPFLWMLSASMKISADVIKLPIDWIPDYFYPDNYKVVWNLDGMGMRNYHFALAYWNSLKITVINVAGSLITSSLAGYAFAKIKFRGSNTLFLIYLATMMIPTQVTLIPKFVMFSQFDLIGTIYTMILPGVFSVMGTFLMRQAFIQIQEELRESALIDGAREFTIFRRIMLPLVQSSLASLAMVIFLNNWNNYMDALIFLPNWRLYTIPVALTNFFDESTVTYNLVMAASASALLPVFIVFIAGQKFFVKGLVAGAVKG
ncbi:MAG: carbohydrate ABC transporter permease [Spirochaetota bacterium]|nr:carbohydrate ABC transporter permease [Spirochaetota bacterium]